MASAPMARPSPWRSSTCRSGRALLGRPGPCCFALLLGLPVLRLRVTTSPSRRSACRWRWRRSSPTSRSPARNIGLILPLTRATLFYELALGLLVARDAAISWISRSRFGMGLIAIRENEDAAAVDGHQHDALQSAGVHAVRLFTALAGGIYAYWITFIDPVSAFDISSTCK